MDAAVIKYYRQLLRQGFVHAGSIEDPAIFLDTLSEKIAICAQGGREYLHLYLAIQAERITDVRYLCICDPTANVVIEVLCSLVKGKTLSEALVLSPESFFGVIGSRSDEVTKKVQGALQLLQRGLARYRSGTPAQ